MSSLITPSGASNAPLDAILKAFQVTGARFGAQVGALAIRAFHEARVGSQPTLYWRMSECPQAIRGLVPADALTRTRSHVALVSAGVEPPWWVPGELSGDPTNAMVHLRTDSGDHVFVW